MVVLGRGAVSYERGSPVREILALLRLFAITCLVRPDVKPRNFRYTSRYTLISKPCTFFLLHVDQTMKVRNGSKSVTQIQYSHFTTARVLYYSACSSLLIVFFTTARVLYYCACSLLLRVFFTTARGRRWSPPQPRAGGAPRSGGGRLRIRCLLLILLFTTGFVVYHCCCCLLLLLSATQIHV